MPDFEANWDPVTDGARREVKHFRSIPVIDTGAYAVADNIGGLITLTAASHFFGKGGFIHQVGIIDKSANKARVDIMFFNANPTASTLTNNAAMVIHANDQAKVICTVPVLATDHVLWQTGLEVATVRSVGATFECADRDLFAAVRINEIKTYAVGDLQFIFGLAHG